VGTSDGATVTLPWVAGDTVANGDTRDNLRMPSIHGLLPNCGILQTWADLVTCVEKNNAGWYVDAVNRFAPRSGFNWNDVVKWAAAKTADGKVPEERVIMLTGVKTRLTDAEANAAVKELTGGATLQVIRLKQDGYTNTWRTDGPGMRDFVDYNDEVRVTLVPLVLNQTGNAVGLNADLMFSGTFVDCKNVHWLDWFTPAEPTNPVCPVGSALAGQPLPGAGYAGCNPTPTCPSGWSGTPPNCLQPKAGGDGVGARGGLPTQQSGHGPGLPTPSATAPAVASPTATYSRPATPTATTPPTTARPTPSPTATGANTPSPGATTCVPPPGKTCQ
jgi:hypothetical protein